MDNPSSIRTAVRFIGIPASGKTTFFSKYFVENYIHINLDTLHTRKKEAALLVECVSKGKSFVVDNTNPKRTDRERYIAKAKAEGYRIVGYFFQSVISDCIVRNRNRAGKMRVPDIAIISKSNELEFPCFSEGYDALFFVKMNDDEFIIEEWNDEL